MANVSKSEIDAFVHRVVGWSQTLQAYADAGVNKAQAALMAGDIDFATFNKALQHKVAVTQSCAHMIDAASSVLLKVAEAELVPIEKATERMKNASTKLQEITDGLELMGQLFVAAGALATAMLAPSPATIGAAASAVATVAEGVMEA